MRTLLLLAVFLHACTLFDPTIEQLVATPGACGAWTAEVKAEGWYGEVELAVDGVPVHRWPLRGQLDVVEQGEVDPGQTIELIAQAKNAFSRASITTGGVSFSPSLHTETVPVPRVTGSLGPTCALQGATWEAVITPGAAHLSGPVSATGDVDIKLPAGVVPPYTVAITAHTRSGASFPLEPFAVAAPSRALSADDDDDGYTGAEDCDDHSAAVHPGAAEAAAPNGKDDDCDGTVDEGTRAFDDDGDGVSEDAGDCDDDDAKRYPGAVELPDCRDQNCDGKADEGVVLPQVDDAYEPDNTISAAWDLKTGSEGSFRRELRIVTSGASDDEWVRFHSADDIFDDWGIDVVADQAPAGAVYEIEVVGPNGATTERISAEGGGVYVRGRAFSTDSGDYSVRIKPVRVPAWCPAIFSVVSR